MCDCALGSNIEPPCGICECHLRRSRSFPRKRAKTPLNAITPEFITETYGIPREGPYYQTDRSRASSKMPCCHECKKREGDIDYAEIEACYKKLREIDDFLVSKEF
ncbi:MAG: hypothetical protein ACKPKO_42275 [Candidatus Fonsibacter sp.]